MRGWRIAALLVWAGGSAPGAAARAQDLPALSAPDTVLASLRLDGEELVGRASLRFGPAPPGGSELAFRLGGGLRIESVTDGHGPLAWRERAGAEAAAATAPREIVVIMPSPRAVGAPSVVEVRYRGPAPGREPWGHRWAPETACLPLFPGDATCWVVDLDGDAAFVGGSGRPVRITGESARLVPPHPCVAPFIALTETDTVPWRPAGAARVACLGAASPAQAGGLADRAARLLARAEADWGPWPWRDLLLVVGPVPGDRPRSWPGVIELPAAAAADSGLGAHAVLFHEILHGWFGHAVRAPTVGDWSEGLCALLADHDLRAQAHPDSAAAFRRGLLWQFAQLAGGPRDVPLAACPAGDAASAPLTYGKGLYFQLELRRQVGAARFAAGLRGLLALRAGAQATWTDLFACLHEPADTELGPFFRAWLEARGAARLSVGDAGYDRARREVRFTITQGPADGAAMQPAPRSLRLRVLLGGLSAQPAWVALDHAETTCRLPAAAPPAAVVVDPAWETFRLFEGDGRLVAPLNGSGRAPAPDRR